VRLLRLKFRIKINLSAPSGNGEVFLFSAARESEMDLTGYISKKTFDRSVIMTPVVSVIVSAAAIIAVIAIVIIIVPPPGAA